MFLIVDANDERPLYKQVIEGIKALIARGELREGMTLPSVRQVAGDLAVNLNTIAFAYRELQDEGLLRVRHGSGAVVTSNRARGRSTEGELRIRLRSALTELVLAGFSDREIARIAREEIRVLRRKGEPQ
jgi:GntR family transcriptional regulator